LLGSRLQQLGQRPVCSAKHDLLSNRCCWSVRFCSMFAPSYFYCTFSFLPIPPNCRFACGIRAQYRNVSCWGNLPFPSSLIPTFAVRTLSCATTYWSALVSSFLSPPSLSSRVSFWSAC
jgi:hypothetical protein